MDLQAWLDQQHAHMAEKIRRIGWAIQYIGGDCCSRPGCESPPDDGPPFAYTVGLFGFGHPELLMVGVNPATAAGVLNSLAAGVREGMTVMPGQLITFENWPHRIITETVPNPGDIVFWANDFYRRPADHSVPVLQLTYDDTEGRFPWDEGYATPELQPRPGTFTA
ncbi:MAG: DUF4262 domain-containing protein [Actinomycetota bacterium]|nr:DUF4262 domain-containing protein [Actinomycetota bacterium]